MEEKNQIVVYQPNDTIRLDVRLENETVWLNQSRLGELFGVDRTVVNRHIHNIYKTGELEKSATCAKIAQVQIEGGRAITRHIPFYNLDVIIAVGYRVNSFAATQFRKWATNVLRNYLLHGYAVNDRIERLERRVAKHDEQIGLFLKTALPPVEGVLFEGQICDAYATAMKIIKSAKKSLVLIDNWLDETVLTMLGGRGDGVKATIYTKKIGRKLQLDINRYNEQYAPIAVKPYSGAHDRFIIIDEETVYHIGASLKDLGHSLFAFSKLQIPAKDILSHLP
ncbi:MAG: virulence RhuM family protein [Kiritimatiellae bacterium]|nr:virulence RhuM family protein [Kiritimatiellia bacterium]